MTITRIYTTADGGSRFAEARVLLRDGGSIERLSAMQDASGIIFQETGAEHDSDWQPAPQRQYLVLLDGHIEIEVSGGEKREFRGGDILLMEDTSGQGHRTRTVDGKPRRSIVIVAPKPDEDVVAEASVESFPASDAPSWTGTAL